ncbi:MAG: ABC transporter ATP-binding protein [Leptolyngbya sp. SIO4C5]|nr:ABC transporter ATP-binding protein [Leptolyngbya sp. SIO4C5]
MFSPPLITLNQVSKVYPNGTVALQDVNLQVRQGEFVSLVGPSGCGKSTVLKLMAGLGKTSRGDIHWRRGEAEPELAFVFQDAALMPWATVMDNVHLPLKLKGRSLTAARADIYQALHLVDLAGIDQRYPRQLSGGMKMRVSIARALVTHPNVLLMDEPFGALDEMTRSKLNSDLLRLWEQYHWTVVFVTHNIYEAVYLSNRVVVMAAQPGRVVADIAIDAPYPRDQAFRTSHLFSDYCREVLTQLSLAETDAIA